MDPINRFVISLPLVQLWNTSGNVHASATAHIGEIGIVPLLVSGSTFVVADVGHPLQWISSDERFTFWKTEVKARLIPPETTSFHPDDYPGEYCYVAVQWECHPSGTVIVLEKHH